MTSHKCFISFKSDDMHYKKYIQNYLDIDMIDKSLNEPIQSENEDYIMRKIREDYLQDSTVTIHLIGQYSAENSYLNQNYIKRELQASLSNTSAGTRNGILGVVLPELYDKIYKGQQACSQCFKNHNIVVINENTTIREFSYNYYLPLDNGEHVWSEDDRYCVLVKWEDFIVSPNKYIEQAFNKRASDIAKKIKVRP
ncbi:TIR domain-containing protein [Streptococcus alactolyticus]|uniref:TIR domain-containing protein n=1 Tax=Streptococcus alactolyticus TaxID=29389 RepID=UPI003D0912D7